MKGQIAGGYNLAMKVMVINRVGAVLFFLLIAINIDNGIAPRILVNGFSIAILITCLPTALILFWAHQRVKKENFELQYSGKFNWLNRIFVATFAATIFNLMGLTIPLIAGATYPEFRLTLANTSFLFNTTYTVINVFYIESAFAKLLDSKKDKVNEFVVGLVAARLAAFVVFASALWIAPSLWVVM